MAEAEKKEAGALTQELSEDISNLRADDDIMSDEHSSAAGGMPTAFAEPKQKAAGGRRMRWYILHAYSGFEKKVAQQIREKAIQHGMNERIEEVVVPTEDVMEVRRGKKTSSERKFFPGYVLVKMELSDETWHLIKNIEKVTGFLGGGGKPQPVPQREIDAIFQQIEEGVTSGGSGIIFEIGEQVKVIDGPFDSFTGTVEDIDEEKEKVKVSVSIFGRATPVELDYTQVEKL